MRRRIIFTAGLVNCHKKFRSILLSFARKVPLSIILFVRLVRGDLCRLIR